jgi:uncharacterized protein with PQ loop repeat
MVQHQSSEFVDASRSRLPPSLDWDPATLLAYVGSVVFMFFMYEGLSDKDFSVVLTFGSLVQCLAFLQLSIKVYHLQSLDGVSTATLEIYAVALCARLCSTLYLNGYLPLDSTGDVIYQIGDVLSLALVARLLYLARRGATYGAEHVPSKDELLPELVLETRTAILVALIVAVAVHPNLDHWLPFDVAWATSLYLDTLAMVPQLVLLQVDGSSEAPGMHFTVLMFLSRSLGALFWFHGFADVAPTAGGVNYAGWGVVVANMLQLASLAYAILRCFCLQRKDLLGKTSAETMTSLQGII